MVSFSYSSSHASEATSIQVNVLEIGTFGSGGPGTFASRKFDQIIQAVSLIAILPQPNRIITLFDNFKLVDHF